MNSDPVQQIKKEEENSHKKIAKTREENHKKLEDKKIDKEKDLQIYKDSLSEGGRAELEEAKQKGMNEFKKITQEEEQKRSSIISHAKTNKDSAVKKVVTFFEKHLA